MGRRALAAGADFIDSSPMYGRRASGSANWAMRPAPG
jgi:aryl-alcohol dehydrogenase-like predicted oxidoreductase